MAHDGLFPQLILERLPLGVAVIRHGRLTWANPGMAEILACPQAELPEIDPAVFFPEAADFRPRLRRAVEQVLQGAPPATLDLPLRRFDGRPFWARLSFQSLDLEPPRPSRRRRPPGAEPPPERAILFLLQDVSETHQAEDRLVQFERAIESGPTSIMITDPSPAIQYVNPCFTAVTGYSFAEALGQNPRILKTDLTPPETHLSLWRTLLAGSEWHGEFANRRKNGEIYWEYASISPLLDAEGRTTHYVAVKEEITSRKLVELRLQRQNEQFAALHQASLELMRHHRLDSFLKSLLQRFLQLLQAPYGDVLLLEGGDMIVGAFTPEQSLKPGQVLERGSSPLAWLAVETRSAAVQNDYRRWAGRLDMELQVEAVACFPLLSGRRCLGVVSVGRDNPEAPFDDEDLQVGGLLVKLASLALENVRLYTATQAEIGERRLAERRYRSLFEQTHDAIFLIDLQGRHIEANQRAADLLGYTNEEIQEMDVFQTSAQIDDSMSVLERLMQGDYLPTFERLFRRKDGSIVPVEINVELVRDETGAPLHIQSMVRDISERKRAEQELLDANQRLQAQLEEIQTLQAALREQAIRDPLTHLYNRRYLLEVLPGELARARRAGAAVSFLMLDIDHFKKLNDSYGHDVGDQALKLLAALLERATRAGDIVCRYGGEEFLVALPQMPFHAAVARAEDVRQAVEGLVIRLPYNRVGFTISIGVASFPQDGSNLEDLVRAADQALYRAKAAGRNQVRT